MPHPCLRSRDTVKVIRVRKIGIGVRDSRQQWFKPYPLVQWLASHRSGIAHLLDGLPRSDGHGNSSDLLNLIRDPSGQSFLTPFITEVKLGDLDIPPLLVFDCLPPACIFQPLTGVMPSVELNADLVFRVSEVKI